MGESSSNIVLRTMMYIKTECKSPSYFVKFIEAPVDQFYEGKGRILIAFHLWLGRLGCDGLPKVRRHQKRNVCRGESQNFR
jgi:hypothetical protein